ncbi:putative double-stranded RNA/RNA-DNA hybrid binding protein [Ceratocystis lukuohia]|uniref:Double-stranded RNA/RNA-DNA hybrid binding protein n=1 Tax=Ceratocystis lukuohia TaxID=2019550 RepID=A0ABR4MFV4_9PEZI
MRQISSISSWEVPGFLIRLLICFATPRLSTHRFKPSACGGATSTAILTALRAAIASVSTTSLNFPHAPVGAGGAVETVQVEQTEEAQSQASTKDTTMLDPENDLMVHPLSDENHDIEMQPAPTEVAQEQTMEDTLTGKGVDTELTLVPITTAQTLEISLMEAEEEVEGTIMSEETAQRLEELSSQKAGKCCMHKELIKLTKVLKKACVMLAGLNQSRPKEHVPVPRTYWDAVNDPDWGEMWVELIKAELMALIANNTWEIVAHKEGMNLLMTKWVFQLKHHIDGSL